MENQNSVLNINDIENSLSGVDTDKIFSMFRKVRRMTIELCEPLEIEDYVVQTESFMSPPRWHLGHVTWFYDQLLKKYFKDYKPYKQDFSFYLNSYYQAFGKPFNKSRRGTISRPTVKETIEYWNYINREVSRFFETAEMKLNVLKDFMLAFNHEWQHQELLVYDLQHLLQDQYHPKSVKNVPQQNGQSHKKYMIKIPGGIYELGFDILRWKDQFAYDIEMPQHKVYLNDYMIDNAPVTNSDYLNFINDGGYSNFKFWLDEGWQWVNSNKIEAPLYWERDESGSWFKCDFKGKRFLENFPNEPVTNISFFEADAYARWAGKRLPTEAEWEKAASWDEDKGIKRLYPWGDNEPDEFKCNLLESRIWSPAVVFAYEQGKSYYGCYGMIGDTWEWTGSEFVAYPGFRSGFAEYNDKWFTNQKVLRGGSFGTPKDSTRNTYRNFFKAHERWLISGFRCAKDA
ncbi:MAG TPA: ergothioneine biosynthesis protein EgtB [Ignavibacteria bacterium]|nr:ergothioneine biosynthesis protein EgtB [Ignavibacteria bacterium]